MLKDRFFTCTEDVARKIEKAQLGLKAWLPASGEFCGVFPPGSQHLFSRSSRLSKKPNLSSNSASLSEQGCGMIGGAAEEHVLHLLKGCRA